MSDRGEWLDDDPRWKTIKDLPLRGPDPRGAHAVVDADPEGGVLTLRCHCGSTHELVVGSGYDDWCKRILKRGAYGATPGCKLCRRTFLRLRRVRAVAG